MPIVEYNDSRDIAYFNGGSYRRDKNTGYYLSGKAANGLRVRLHRAVYEAKNGEIPNRYHVHHIDGDKRNNEPSNLALMSEHDHISYHSRQPEQIEKSRKNIAIVQEHAKAWHCSESGREWHKAHFEQTRENLYRRVAKCCSCCGKDYESDLKAKSRFCSNACKSKSRRNSGVDNEKRVCAVCGSTFEINRFQSTRTCSRKCAASLRQCRVSQKATEA